MVLDSGERWKVDGLYFVLIFGRPALTNSMIVFVIIAFYHFYIESGEGMLLVFVLSIGLSLVVRID